MGYLLVGLLISVLALLAVAVIAWQKYYELQCYYHQSQQKLSALQEGVVSVGERVEGLTQQLQHIERWQKQVEKVESQHSQYRHMSTMKDEVDPEKVMQNGDVSRSAAELIQALHRASNRKEANSERTA